jgi:hypothetical protein
LGIKTYDELIDEGEATEKALKMKNPLFKNIDVDGMNDEKAAFISLCKIIEEDNNKTLFKRKNFKNGLRLEKSILSKVTEFTLKNAEYQEIP